MMIGTVPQLKRLHDMTAAAQFIFTYVLFKGFKINTYLLACGKQILAFGEYKHLGHMHYSSRGWKETRIYSNKQYLISVRDDCSTNGISTLYISFVLFACLIVFGATTPQWARASSFTSFLHHTQRRSTVGRTHLDE
jgi:hypothetical protein